VIPHGLLNRGNSDDHESSSRSLPTANLSNVICRTAAQQLTTFQPTYSASRCPSEVAEFLVETYISDVPIRILCNFLTYCNAIFATIYLFSLRKLVSVTRCIETTVAMRHKRSTPIAVLPLSHCSPPLLYHSTAPQRANQRTVI